MTRSLLLMILIILCASTMAQEPNILLGRPTDRSITLNLLSGTDVPVYIEYGKTKESYSDKTSILNLKANKPETITIHGLSADTRYYYRLQYKKGLGSDPFTSGTPHRFQTQRKKGESFSFAVEADPHLDSNSIPEAYRLTLKNMLEKEPDFMIDLGDNFMNDKLPLINRDEITKRNTLFRSFFNELTHSVPLFIAIGNHEGETGWKAKPGQDSLPIWARQTRKLYYPNPIPDGFYSGNNTETKGIGYPENYYAWEWGDALFVVIDPYCNTKNRGEWNWTLGKDQYDWFKKTLETSRSRFKFVFSHQIVGGSGKEGRGGTEFVDLFEMGGKNTDGSWGFDNNRPGWGKPIHSLMVENKVSAFFHGHDHFFGKQEKDGIVYQTVPQPSARNINKITGSAYGYKEGLLMEGRGYLQVSVSPKECRIDYIRTYLPGEERLERKNGEIAYSYTIK
ncbi:MAG: hypothetical protein RLZZ45_670 [Bacteroidota bacterium]